MLNWRNSRIYAFRVQLGAAEDLWPWLHKAVLCILFCQVKILAVATFKEGNPETEGANEVSL
jgi:hypothetical protein